MSLINFFKSGSRGRILVAALLTAASSLFASQQEVESVFYPQHLIGQVQSNVEKYPWAQNTQKSIISRAQRWMQMSDNELWGMMFSSTLDRAWMVWSNGHCPACKEEVPMYNWQIDAWKHPWKVLCPHCKEAFPKNDFEKYYISGLDQSGSFSYELADSSLLFNSEHPDPADRLHKFGVDDGRGFKDGDNIWRFIAAYLVYGQWNQKVLAGISALSDAYVVSGNKEYAHRAAILLDRVADFYPDFDFHIQGWMYERIDYSAGYVTYWQKAGQDSRLMAEAFDKIRPAIVDDEKLFEFLSEKSKKHSLANPKQSFEDIQRNIFDRILLDSIQNESKIRNNFPIKEESIAIMKSVMSWHENRDEIMEEIKSWLSDAVSVDGVTGEKGLYSALGPNHIKSFLSLYNRIDDKFLEDMMSILPGLSDTYLFHIHTRVLDGYNILPGDSGKFAQRAGYPISFSKSIGLHPSAFSFFLKLYEITGNEAYIQLLYQQNGCKVDGLPYDLFCNNPEMIQKKVADVISRYGQTIHSESINKKQWHLAIMRSGEGDNARAMWLDYDNQGSHRHHDAMSLGLFAKGLDLMVDFGYPPVQFGGWGGEKFDWYQKTVSHNTVAVDGKNVATGAGKTTIWADGESFKTVRASGKEFIDGKQYERTAIMVDISESDSYIVDVFRVVGGLDHAKFISSTFGDITTDGLVLSDAKEYGHGALMRNYRFDPQPQLGWSVDWKAEDYYGYLPKGSDIHLRYHDFSEGVEAYTAEAWVVAGGYESTDEQWIPRIMVRRRGQEPLESTFVGVIEPYENSPIIKNIRRLPLQTSQGLSFPNANAALEIELIDGRKDLIIAADVENPLNKSSNISVYEIVQPDWAIRTNAEIAMIRKDLNGEIVMIAIANGDKLSTNAGNLVLENSDNSFAEIKLANGRFRVISGDKDSIQFEK